MNFDLPKGQSSPIKVIGVGGGGSNAVNYMYNSGIQGVDFIVCNTDAQALENSPVPIKVQLGASLTEGRGAGSIPEVGKNAAIETIDDLRGMLEKNTAMVFITAGMGGGTGTGAAPVIAQIARELGILTVGIVTYPFKFEGNKRAAQADLGLAELREYVDTLLVIQNDKLREIYGKMSIKQAFSKADDVLAIAAKGITEVINIHGEINVDMNDVKTVMRDSGLAIMGSASASGEDRAIKAIEAAIESPLLNDNDIHGANHVLLYMTFVNDEEAELDEITRINDYVQEAAGNGTNIIWGYGTDPNQEEEIRVTVVATGFNSTAELEKQKKETTNRIEHTLDDSQPAKPIQNPIQSPVASKPVEEVQHTPIPEPVLMKKTEVEQPRFELKKTFDFDVTAQQEKREEPVVAEKEEPKPAPQPEAPKKTVYDLYDDEKQEEAPAPTNFSSVKQHTPPVTPSAQPPVDYSNMETENEKLPAADFQRITEERYNKIKEMNNRMKNNIADLEKEPAINRASTFKITEQPHSSENNMSRYSLGENGEFRKNNTFLFDNVD